MEAKCPAPWKVFFVEANGNARPCCLISKPMGNINEQTFEEIWNGELYQELRRTFIEQKDFWPECVGCSHHMRTDFI